MKHANKIIIIIVENIYFIRMNTSGSKTSENNKLIKP